MSARQTIAPNVVVRGKITSMPPKISALPAKISYGLYAYHFLGLQLSQRLLTGYHHSHGWTLSWLCALAITFSLAAASFKWLESPFLRLKRTRFTYVPSGAAS